MFSLDGALISASAAPHCGAELKVLSTETQELSLVFSFKARSRFEFSFTYSAYCHRYCLPNSCLVRSFDFIFPTPIQGQSGMRSAQCIGLLPVKFFDNCIVQLRSSHGKSGLLPPGKASCDRVAPPKLWCMLGAVVVSINPTPEL